MIGFEEAAKRNAVAELPAVKIVLCGKTKTMYANAPNIAIAKIRKRR